MRTLSTCLYELVFHLFPGRESSSDYKPWTDRKVGGEILTALTELNRREIMQWIKCVAHHHIPPLSVHGGDMNQINIGKENES